MKIGGIDWEVFEKLCNIQCTPQEIADFFRVSKHYLQKKALEVYKLKTFDGIYRRYSSGGRISLRRLQFRLAEKHAGMAIWLGKQYLGQKDHQDLTPDMQEKIDKFSQLLMGLEAGNKQKNREDDYEDDEYDEEEDDE